MCTPCVRLSCGMRGRGGAEGEERRLAEGRAFGERSGAGRGRREARLHTLTRAAGARVLACRGQRKGAGCGRAAQRAGEAVPRSARRGAFASRASVAGRSAVAERGGAARGEGRCGVPVRSASTISAAEHPAGPAAPGGAARSEGPRKRQRDALRRSTPFPSGAPARAGRDPPPRLPRERPTRVLELRRRNSGFWSQFKTQNFYMYL
jgi:hypothetical protein